MLDDMIFVAHLLKGVGKTHNKLNRLNRLNRIFNLQLNLDFLKLDYRLNTRHIRGSIELKFASI